MTLEQILNDLEALYHLLKSERAWTQAIKVKEIQAKVLMKLEKVRPQKKLLTEWTQAELERFLGQIEKALVRGKEKNK